MTKRERIIAGTCFVLFWFFVSLALGIGGWNGTPYGWIPVAFWFGFSISKFHNVILGNRAMDADAEIARSNK
jgi:hypothetical protein